MNKLPAKLKKELIATINVSLFESSNKAIPISFNTEEADGVYKIVSEVNDENNTINIFASLDFNTGDFTVGICDAYGSSLKGYNFKLNLSSNARIKAEDIIEKAIRFVCSSFESLYSLSLIEKHWANLYEDL